MLPGIGTPVKASGKSCNFWTLEWTYTGAAGEVLLDSAASDLDSRVATPVADSGTTGVTSIRFPKCERVRVVHCSIEAAVAGTLEMLCRPGAILPSSGSMNFVHITAPTTLAHPSSGSRARLTLDLEYA
jgi:hypothetical protein